MTESKRRTITRLTLLAVLLVGTLGGCPPQSPTSEPKAPKTDEQATEPSAAAPQAAQTLPKMKMTTPIPANVFTPDEVKTTRLGTLRFKDGVPTEETAQKVWDQLDFQRAVELMILTTPAASLSGFRRSIREWGPDNKTMIYWHGRMDSKVLILTPNTSVVYGFLWINLKDGPLVMETPPKVLGIIDSFWFKYTTDFGNAGPDRGEGGKYLLLPPGYQGKVPQGYYVVRCQTYGNWLAVRGFMKDFDAEPVVKNMKDHFRLYPLGDAPKEVNWVNVSMKSFNTLHAQDIGFFREVNEVVQEEPNASEDAEILGLLAAIGIEKGRAFEPDARMRAILTEAAAVGTAAQRSILFRNRDKSVMVYPDSKTWEIGFAGGSYAFLRNGVSLINERTRFHYYATGITPAMVKPPVGLGSQYMIAVRDSAGKAFDGAKTYKMHIPGNVPARNFWDVTVYDNQTRSLLQTDQTFSGISSIDKGIQQNDDGSWDLYFGPKAPEGKASNWLQTIPGKGWNLLWRIYGPEKAWYDKTWRPGDIELSE